MSYWPRLELYLKPARALSAAVRPLFTLICLGCLCLSAAAAPELDQNLDVLQVGTVTYRNVTVTTKGKNYIFILHSKGMTNLKVADLSDEVRTRLGYEPAAKPAAPSKTPGDWARQTLSKLQGPPVKKLEGEVVNLWPAKLSLSNMSLPRPSMEMMVGSAAVLLGLYLFHCYCWMLICFKCEAPPGIWVWLPLLQVFPMLKAARMSAWWFVSLLIPGINLVTYLVGCVKITQARRKGPLCALFLIFPLTLPLAVMYLAFSDAHRPRRESRRIEIMTLETA